MLEYQTVLRAAVEAEKPKGCDGAIHVRIQINMKRFVLILKKPYTFQARSVSEGERKAQPKNLVVAGMTHFYNT